MPDDTRVAPGQHLDPFETKPEEKGISMVMALVAQVAAASGNVAIKNLPDLWHYTYGDGWELHVNGHDDQRSYALADIPPYHALIMYDGLPALLVGPFDGVALGSTSEFEAIDSLTAELRRLNRSRPEQNPLTGG